MVGRSNESPGDVRAHDPAPAAQLLLRSDWAASAESPVVTARLAFVMANAVTKVPHASLFVNQ